MSREPRSTSSAHRIAEIAAPPPPPPAPAPKPRRVRFTVEGAARPAPAPAAVPAPASPDDAALTKFAHTTEALSADERALVREYREIASISAGYRSSGRRQR